MIYIHDPDSGLQFEWNEAHTVNVQALGDATRDLDCYSIGDYAKGSATLAEFRESIEEYLSEER